MLGTARYASPEQARGETLDGRSDVYSLALVIVEAVTGDVPFTADTTIGTLMARLDHSVVVPEELDTLAPVVVAAGRLDIEERLDAGGLARGLVEAAGELTRPAPLPLVGAAGETVVSLDGRDATLLGPGARTPAPANGAPAAGTGAADLAGAVFAGPPAGTDVLAAPSAARPLAGADTTRLDVPTVAPVLRSPPDGLPAHAGAAPPWSTSPGAAGGMSPNDRSARRLMLGAAVVIIAVAVGIVGGWLYMQSQIPSHPVPAELVGMQRDALPAAIDDFDWEIRDETTRRDGTQPGQILETEPAAGEMLREGDTLTVLVSEGATLVDVPSDLAGMTGEDAAAALEAAGFVPELVEQPSEEVDEGLVIGFADGDPGDRGPQGVDDPPGGLVRRRVRDARPAWPALRRRGRHPRGRRAGRQDRHRHRRRRRGRARSSAPTPRPARRSSPATASRWSSPRTGSRCPSCGATASRRPQRPSRTSG